MNHRLALPLVGLLFLLTGRVDAQDPDPVGASLASIGYVSDVAVSRDGSRLALYLPELRRRGTLELIQRPSLRLWDLTENKELLNVEGSGRGVTLAISPNARYAALASTGKTAILFDLTAGTKREFDLDKTQARNLCFSRDGTKLVYTLKRSRTQVLAMLDIAAGTIVEKKMADGNSFYGATFSPVTGNAAIGRSVFQRRTRSRKTLLDIYQLTPFRKTKTIEMPTYPSSLAYSADGKILAVRMEDKTISLFDTATWKVRTSFHAENTGKPNSGVVHFAVSIDGNWIATKPLYTGSPPVELWDAASGTVREVGPNCQDLTFHPSGVLVVATRKGVLFFEPASGNQVSPPFPAVEIAISNEPEFRTWTSSIGDFTVEAVLLGVEDKVVVLRRKDGKEIKVPIDKLSPKDQAFVASR